MLILKASFAVRINLYDCSDIILKITIVNKYKQNKQTPAYIAYLDSFHPVSYIDEGPLVRTVIQQQDTVRAPEVGLCDTPEALLACRVPQL